MTSSIVVPPAYASLLTPRETEATEGTESNAGHACGVSVWTPLISLIL